MRNPIVISVDQVLAEAGKIERWIQGAGPGATMAGSPYATGSTSGQWVTVGGVPTPVDPPATQQRQVKKADWSNP